MERSGQYMIGDPVKYVGPFGLYEGVLELNHGDTGVVTALGKPSKHFDNSLTVTLFKNPNHPIQLPRSFFLPI